MRRAAYEDCPAYLVRRGDLEAGDILIRLDHGDGNHTIFGRQRDANGTVSWQLLREGDSDQSEDTEVWLSRLITRDPDLWIVEIEDFNREFQCNS